MAGLDVDSPNVAPVVNGVNGSHSQNETNGSASVSSSDIENYLCSLLGVALGASRYDLEAEHSLLSPPLLSETVERCRGFLQSSRLAIYALRFAGDRIEDDSLEPNSGTRTTKVLCVSVAICCLTMFYFRARALYLLTYVGVPYQRQHCCLRGDSEEPAARGSLMPAEPTTANCEPPGVRSSVKASPANFYTFRAPPFLDSFSSHAVF